MPTAARLFAGLLFAGLGYYVSVLVVPALPEGTTGLYFHLISAACGGLSGWIVAGGRAGAGYVAAFSYGLTAMVVMVFWALLIFSSHEMIIRSLRKMYPEPTRALEAVFGLFVEYGQFLLTPQILVLLVGGSLLAGLLVEAVGRRWP